MYLATKKTVDTTEYVPLTEQVLRDLLRQDAMGHGLPDAVIALFRPSLNLPYSDNPASVEARLRQLNTYMAGLLTRLSQSRPVAKEQAGGDSTQLGVISTFSVETVPGFNELLAVQEAAARLPGVAEASVDAYARQRARLRLVRHVDAVVKFEDVRLALEAVVGRANGPTVIALIG